MVLFSLPEEPILYKVLLKRKFIWRMYGTISSTSHISSLPEAGAKIMIFLMRMVL